MRVWERVRRTGQREAKAFVLSEVLAANSEQAPPLVPEQDYFRVCLAEMFLGTRSTLTSTWVPAAHARVSTTRSGGSPVEYSKVFRPDRDYLAQGIKLNYQLTDLLPYRGGVVEVEAALVAWRQSSRVSVALDILQAVSTLPIPPLAPALAIAGQVTDAARKLVDQGDGEVHLDLHQSFVSGGGNNQGPQQGSNILRPGYFAALLADENEVSPGTLRVVGSRLHRLGPDGQTRHLRGWDFLLLQIEGRSQLDDFWLPELEDLFGQAVEALRAGKPAVASYYREAAIAVAYRSPAFNWADRDRVIETIKSRFDYLDQRGLGASTGTEPASLAETVRLYGPSIDQIRKHGRMTEASAFSRA